MKLFSTLANPVTVIGASVVSAVVLRKRRNDAIRMLVSAPLALAISGALKNLVREHRPRLFDDEPEQSFPSGHSAGLSAFMLALIGATRSRWSILLATGSVLGTNIVRVKEREHWPIDVAMGDVIGALGALLGAIAAAHLVPLTSDPASDSEDALPST